MNKNSLKAAVKKYKPMLSEGKTEEEIKAALAADEKKYAAEDITEIFSNLSLPDEPEKGTYTVKVPFRDKDNFDKLYDVDEDVSHFDEKRITDLKAKGLLND